MMRINHTSPAVRLTGRWDKRNDKVATATTPGAVIELAFRGNMAVLAFDVETNEQPYPHLWISVDGGGKIEAPLDSFLRVMAPENGQAEHVVQIIYKGGVERHHRWYPPLTGKISFLGADVEEAGVLPPEHRKTIEFVGDSITEGVLTDDYSAYLDGQHNRVYTDDVCATYAWKTAEALNLRPIMMGYGAVGITKSGQGAVPKAEEAYPYCYYDCPITHAPADYIVINHGANDQNASVESYISGYERLLDVIRKRNPTSKCIVLGAFCGVFAEELRTMVENYNQKNDAAVFYIDTVGWIPKEPLHPLRAGHQVIADHLVPILKERYGL